MAADYEARLRRVIDYIYDHTDENLSLDTLADVAAMSRFHWHRVFRAMTGETCAQAVRRVRLQRAGFMLSNTQASIDEIARAFEQFSAIMSARSLWPHTRGMLGAYYDDPMETPVEDLRSLAGAVVDTAMEIPAGMTEIRIPAGPLAKLRYKGPYGGLPKAYDYLYGRWLPENGHQPNNDVVSFEFYLNSPMDTAPDDLLTDICVPLR